MYFYSAEVTMLIILMFQIQHNSYCMAIYQKQEYNLQLPQKLSWQSAYYTIYMLERERVREREREREREEKGW